MSEPRHVYDDNLAAEIERLRSRNIETVYQENRALEEEIERLREENATLLTRAEDAELLAERRRWGAEEMDRLRERIEELDQAGNRIGKKLDAARRRIEELEQSLKARFRGDYEGEGIFITRDQIRAAWDRIAAVNKCNDQWCMYRSEANRWGRDILEDIGIVRCENTECEGGMYLAAKYTPQCGVSVCPTCHGEGWVIGGEGE